MSELQLDIAFYVMLTLAFLYVLMLINKAVRYIVKANHAIFSNTERTAQEVKRIRNKSVISKPSNMAVPVVYQEEPSVFNDELDMADQFSDLDLQVIDALKTGIELPAFTEVPISEIKPDTRLRELAFSKPTVFNKAKKPMATLKLVTTRVVTVPDNLTDEAIHLLEKPAYERYPSKRLPFKHKSKRRDAINAFVDNLPRTAAM